MVRYQDDDSETGRTLLIAAGVVAGLLAGAALASRFGGIKGMRRALSRRRGPLVAAVRAALPSRALRALLDVVGIDEILDTLLGDAPRRRKRLRARRRPDLDLDEFEVDDEERPEAFDEDDEELDDAYSEYEDDDEDDDDLDAPAAQLRRFRYADASDMEDEYADEYADEDEVDEYEDDEDDVIESEHDDEDVEDEDEEAEAPTRESIEQAVLEAFRRHSLLRQRALQIAVNDDGAVELTGWVRRERDLRVARRVARRVPGVTRVIVDVAVRDVVQLVPDARSKGA